MKKLNEEENEISQEIQVLMQSLIIDLLCPENLRTKNILVRADQAESSKTIKSKCKQIHVINRRKQPYG